MPDGGADAVAVGVRARGRLRRLVARHPVLGVGLLLVAVDLLLFYPAVLGGRVLSPEDVLLFHAPLSRLRPASLVQASNYLLSDAVEVFHPDLEWARAAIRSGHLPLWDPYVFGGWPVFASQQTAILYPLNLLAYVLPFWPALGLIAVGKTLLAGLGAWWLCRRRLSLGPAPALLAGVSYSLGSYFVVWLEHPHTNVYALIPWLLGTIELVCARRRARECGLLAALVGCCVLGGHPESSFIAGLGCLGFAASCLTGPDAAGGRRHALLLLAGAVGLGAAAGAVMLVPFGQLAGQAPSLARGGGSGLADRSWLSLLLPDLWGRPDGFEAVGGPSNYAERTFYVGALPLMLAVAGLWRLRAARPQRFFVGMLAGASVLALHVPVVTQAIVNAPGLALVALDRSLILVALSLAVLAAYGLERLLAATPGDRRVMLGLAAAVACAPLVYLAPQARAWRAFPRFSDVAPHVFGTAASSQAQTAAAAGTRWLVFALPALAALWLIGAGRGRRRRRGDRGAPGPGRGPGPGRAAAVGSALAVVLTAADLVALNHGYHPAIIQAVAEPPATPSIAAARVGQGHGRILGYDAYLIPNVPSRYGLRDARGHGLPALGRYLALWNGLGGYGFQQTRLLPGDPRAAELLDEFGVSELVAATDERTPPAAALRPVVKDRDGTVYRNLGALPRAYLAASWRTAPTRAVALHKTLASTPAGLRVAPVIEGVAPAAAVPARPPPGGPPDVGTTRFTEDGGDVVSLAVDARQAGYVVLLDSYYAGWSATVDGHAVAIHPANEAFRAVAVPAGRHRVVFTYRPRLLLGAAGVSALSWVVIAGLLLIGPVDEVRRRRALPGGAPGARSGA